LNISPSRAVYGEYPKMLSIVNAEWPVILTLYCN
jgi:hypothetical protein